MWKQEGSRRDIIKTNKLRDDCFYVETIKSDFRIMQFVQLFSFYGCYLINTTKWYLNRARNKNAESTAGGVKIFLLVQICVKNQWKFKTNCKFIQIVNFFCPRLCGVCTQVLTSSFISSLFEPKNSLKFYKWLNMPIHPKFNNMNTTKIFTAVSSSLFSFIFLFFELLLSIFRLIRK